MASVRLRFEQLEHGRLPRICVVCGRDADGYLPRRLLWRPRSVSAIIWLLVFLCPPLFVIAILLSFLDSQRIDVFLPVCRRHCTYWARRNFWTYGPLWLVAMIAIAMAVLILTRRIDDHALSYLFFGTGIALLAWAVFVAVLRARTIRILRL